MERAGPDAAESSSGAGLKRQRHAHMCVRACTCSRKCTHTLLLMLFPGLRNVTSAREGFKSDNQTVIIVFELMQGSLAESTWQGAGIRTNKCLTVHVDEKSWQTIILYVLLEKKHGPLRGMGQKSDPALLPAARSLRSLGLSVTLQHPCADRATEGV